MRRRVARRSRASRNAGKEALADSLDCGAAIARGLDADRIDALDVEHMVALSGAGLREGGGVAGLKKARNTMSTTTAAAWNARAVKSIRKPQIRA